MSNIGDTIDSLLQQEEFWHQHPSNFRGLPSSLEPINRVTRGYQKSRFYAFGARTGHGKTTFALQEIFFFADHIIKRRIEKNEDLGKVLFINPEMSLEQLLIRYVSSRCAVKFDDIFTGAACSEEREIWRAKMESVREYEPFVVMHAGGHYLLTGIEGEINDIKNKGHQIAILVIDYIQLIQDERRGEDQRVRTMNVSQGLKQLSLKYDIPVITMAQLRNPQTTFYKGERVDEETMRPRIYDMAESSDIQKSADFAAVIFNPDDAYNERDYRPATLYVDKNRGPSAEIGLLFYGEKGEYTPTSEVYISGESR